MPAAGASQPDRKRTAWNNQSTELWFELQQAIPASSTDGSYYVYYGGAPTPAPPADKSSIYLYYDDFESYPAGAAPAADAAPTDPHGGV